MKLYRGMISCRRSVTVALISIAVLVPSSVFAQTVRTTPVEVKNPVSIDATNNTVKAEQLGLWTVNVGGTPSVAQAGLWNVGIVGTPSFNVANSPTVKIDSTTNTVKIDGTANTVKAQIDPSANTVQTPTLHKTIKLLTSDLDVGNNFSTFLGGEFDCGGYKEMRVMVASSVTSANLKVQVQVWYQSGPLSWAGFDIGEANFAPPANPMSENANYVQIYGRCIFSMPVISDRCRLRISNTTGSSVTIGHSSAWVYLVN